MKAGLVGDGKKKPRRKKNFARDRGGMRGVDLLRAVRDHRQRAAIFSRLAELAIGNFSCGYGDPQPPMIIRDEQGNIEEAELEIVVDVAQELKRRARGEMAALAELLRCDLAEVPTALACSRTRVAEGDDLPPAAEPVLRRGMLRPKRKSEGEQEE